MQHKIFDNNQLPINDYIELEKMYKSLQRSKYLIDYLANNEYDIDKFNNIMLLAEKRDKLKQQSNVYSLTIEIVQELGMIMIIETLFDTKFVKEHIFY